MVRRPHLLLVSGALTLLPSGALSQPAPLPTTTLAAEPVAWIATARVAQTLEHLDLRAPASATWRLASQLAPSPALANMLLLQSAAQAILSDTPTLALSGLDAAHPAWRAPIEGAGLLQAQALAALSPERPIDAQATQRALELGPRQDSCDWLIDHLQLAALTASTPALQPHLALMHRHCEGASQRSEADRLGAPVSAQDQLARAEFLRGRVRFFAAIDAWERVPLDKLSPSERCDAHYIAARILMRIKKRRDEADTHDARVIAQCATIAPHAHRSSLYNLGKRSFDRGRFSDAARHFQALLDRHADSRYADDALLFLGRVAIQQGKPEDALDAARRALTLAPDGDTTHELVWDALEPLLRAGKDRAFLDALKTLPLPEHDDEYFSQGRLDYFAARALTRLGDPKAARWRWQQVWARYPLSFYGYLSWLALDDVGARPAPLARPQAQAWPDWLWPAPHDGGEVALLARAGLFSLAASLEHQRQRGRDVAIDDLDRWRLAWLYDRAGRYEVSHNLARRQIKGSPWAAPELGRLTRWQLAWPDPFGALVDASTAQELAQHEGAHLLSALPRAIMREESSFIPEIESYAGALGLMQLMPRTALGHDDDVEGDATPDKLKLPELNIRVGVDHLVYLARRFEGHPVVIAASYNAGGGAARKWLRANPQADIALWVEDIPYLQTRDYTKRVIGSYLAYQWLTGSDSFDTRVGRASPKP